MIFLKDEEIIQLYWERDQNAVSATAEKYGRYCSVIARNILGNAEDAEECVSDTYLRAWNSIPPQRPVSFSAFLGRITRNLAFNRYRHAHTEKRGTGEVPLILDELSECVSAADNIESVLEHRELTEAINDFLKTLSPESRNIFVCRYWYADSITGIAERYGKNGRAVSVTLSRLRTKLRQYLTERGFIL